MSADAGTTGRPLLQHEAKRKEKMCMRPFLITLFLYHSLSKKGVDVHLEFFHCVFTFLRLSSHICTYLQITKRILRIEQFENFVTISNDNNLLVYNQRLYNYNQNYKKILEKNNWNSKRKVREWSSRVGNDWRETMQNKGFVLRNRLREK